jgi:hypothetical protein
MPTKKPVDMDGEHLPDAPMDSDENVSIESRIEMDAFREALVDGVQKMRGAGLVNLLDN